jgi:methyl-accepting chemotaxis protein
VKSNNLSLRARLLWWIAVTVSGGLLLSVAVILQGASGMRQRDALDYVEQLARSRANLAQQALDEASVAARTVAQSLRGMKQAGRSDRTAADALLRGALEGTPGFVGVWTGWEPNAFDGQDAAFAGKPGHDTTSRYVPYWNRGSGIAVEPLVD